MDNTGVHPESYEAAEKLLTMLGYTEADVKAGNLKDLGRKIRDYKKTAETLASVNQRSVILSKSWRSPDVIPVMRCRVPSFEAMLWI